MRHHDGVTARPAVNDARARTLITVDELIRLMDAGTAVVLLDVIDEQGAAPEERRRFRTPCRCIWQLTFPAHRPRHPADGTADVSDLQAKARAWGIGNATPVVVYDNAGSAQASRAWWTLRWAGSPIVRVLDGDAARGRRRAGRSPRRFATRASRAGDVVLTSGTCRRSTPTRRPGSPSSHACSMRGRAHPMWAIRPKQAQDIFRAPFMRRWRQHRGWEFKRATISPPASTSSAPMALARSGSNCGSGNSAAHAIAAMARPARHCALRRIVVGLDADPARRGRDRTEPK